MQIRTYSDFKLLGVGYGEQAEFPKGKYSAVQATNQPDWKAKGKVFIENKSGTSLLLESPDYTKA